MGKLQEILKICYKGYIRNLYWRLVGPRYRNPPLPDQVTSVAFVCKGNICRSAYAHRSLERFLRKDHGENFAPPLRVGSVGLDARTGNGSPETAVAAARQMGIDLTMHRATPLTSETAECSDMLIAMEPAQVRRLRYTYPQRRDHIFLMAAFEQGFERRYGKWQQYHIQDPYGRDAEQFIECFKRLDRCLDGLRKLLKQSKGG